MRSLWKLPFIDLKLLKLRSRDKLVRTRIRNQRNRNILCAKRNSAILKTCVGFIFGVYNGLRFHFVKVTEEMVGHKFGDYSFTRRMECGVEIHRRKTVEENI